MHSTAVEKGKGLAAVAGRPGARAREHDEAVAGVEDDAGRHNGFVAAMR